jgi:hypothetical protein
MLSSDSLAENLSRSSQVLCLNNHWASSCQLGEPVQQIRVKSRSLQLHAGQAAVISCQSQPCKRDSESLEE